MLTDLKSILALAEEKGCAIPAFNCYTVFEGADEVHIDEHSLVVALLREAQLLLEALQLVFILYHRKRPRTLVLGCGGQQCGFKQKFHICGREVFVLIFTYAAAIEQQ